MKAAQAQNNMQNKSMRRQTLFNLIRLAAVALLIGTAAQYAFTQVTPSPTPDSQDQQNKVILIERMDEMGIWQFAPLACSGTCISLTADQVAQAAYAGGSNWAGFRGGALVNAVAVSRAESTFALNAINNNTNGTTDYGLWQINSIHGYNSSLLLSNASYNAGAAYSVANAVVNADWTPWVMFNNGGFVSYLTLARNAAQNIDSTVIRGINDRVVANSNINVRTSAGGSLLRTVPSGTLGTVLQGYQVAVIGSGTYRYVWWMVHWDDGGSDGWSTEDYLSRTSGGPVCTYSISPSSQSFSSSGGTGSVSVTAGSGCSWTATSNAGWIAVTSGSSGGGNGTVGYSVAANTGSARSGSITIAGRTFTVNQGASANCPSPAAISPGQTISGSLQSGDCVFTDGSYYDAYTFTGTANQQIYVTMNSAQLDAWLMLYQGSYPGGTQIAVNDDGGGGTNARIPATSGFLTLPATGTYTILANSASVGETGTYSVTLGSGNAGSVQFSSTAYNVTENGGSATITVTRTGGTGAFVVNYGTSNGTATAGPDYTGLNEVMSFAASETSKTFSIMIVDDTLVEGSETVNLTLSNPSGGVTLGSPSNAVLTILDNDTACTYSISASDNTLSPGSGSASFTMNAPAGCPWSATSDSTWLTTSSSGSGTGTVSYSFAANPSTSPRTGRITVGGQVHTVTQIGLGGAGSVQFSSINYSANEGGGIATVTVTRTGGTGTGTVNYSTSNGTAIAGTDYVSASGLLLFTGSVTSLTFDIMILDDSAFESNETINISLTNPSNSFTLGSPNAATLTIVDNDSPPTTTRKSFDYDGDGKTDASVYRPSTGDWYLLRSAQGNGAYHFGSATDVITPADFTGDGKTDVAVFRPSTGIWYVLRSEDNTYYGTGFGTNGDIPAPADFDGDGKADLSVYRPGQGTWYLQRSMLGFLAMQFGITEDRPAVGDFDGDGKADISVYRPSLGNWYRVNSRDGSFFAAHFGQTGDKIVPADYTGDGRADIAIWRPATGVWYILRSEDLSYFGAGFGLGSDLPAPGDYDGDGRADLAVWRPGAQGIFYIQRSTAGFTAFPWGVNGDMPTANAYVY